MKIKYSASVFTPAGWRSVEIEADAVRVSPGYAVVAEITTINGEPPVGYTSRTGAKRQTYNAGGVAQREIGAKKRISACDIVSV